MRTTLALLALGPSTALAQASQPADGGWGWAWSLAALAIVATLVFLVAREPTPPPRR